MNKKRSLQQKLRQLQESAFVGREQELDVFRNNLELDPEDDRFINIFNVYGQGGVGKTWLVRQFQQQAKHVDAITAYLDEGIEDVTEAMNSIHKQLQQQGFPLKPFNERYQTYREKKTNSRN